MRHNLNARVHFQFDTLLDTLLTRCHNKGVSTVFICLGSRAHVMSLLLVLTAAYCCFVRLARIVCRYSSLLASVGIAKDTRHHSGKSNENCYNMLELLHFLLRKQ